jgi:hypothetical protein
LITAVAAATVAMAVPLTTAQAAPRMVTISPTVSGPVSGGVKGHPFGSVPFDLTPFGYAENEYFLSGRAYAYDVSPVALASFGRPPVPVVAPYTTRMIVRAPVDAGAFNGTVLVEWNNVTSGYDVEPAWVDTWPELVRSGFAYVSVTAQTVGVNALHAYDPVRYAPVVLPGDEFSYDVFTQAMQVLRMRAGVDPMHGLVVGHILATGDSQSGSALDNYVRNVAAAHVADGYLIQTSTGALPSTLDIPVLRLLSEREAGGAVHADTDFYRQWEVAGASHTDMHFGEYAAQTQDRDWGTPPGTWPLTPRDIPGIDGPCLIGRFPKAYVARAALHALDTWVRGGPAPTTAPRITVAGGPIVRDSHGNALGGVRTPAIDVPTAAYYGDGDNECAFTLGKTVPFDAATLAELYPTHDEYVAKVHDAVVAASANGWLLAPDAAEIETAAAESQIGG